MRRFLEEVDIHYLVIALMVSLLFAAGFGHLRRPADEIIAAAYFSIGGNAIILAMSFVGIAPWGFSKAGMIRCLYWIPANFVAGVILTFLVFSPRLLASAVWQPG